MHFQIRMVAAIWMVMTGLACTPLSHAIAGEHEQLGSVIFIHPDGTSAATWAAARAMWVGPDRDLNWDKLPAVAVYRGHMRNILTATSNGGATTHAFGVKVMANAYGRTEAGPNGKDIVDQNGNSLSIARQALAAGLEVALVQTGTNTEPGTGCFLAFVQERAMHDKIASQLVASGASIILGGGEKYFLPNNVNGMYGQGVRVDGRNLVKEAKQAGYTIVQTRDELMSLPVNTPKVLGLFASEHTFNDQTEEELKAAGLPMFMPNAPTVGEMTQVALRMLEHKGKRFLLVVEEEATDNFGNHNNAAGMLEAMRRADEAIGVAQRYIAKHPHTLLLTAADSDAGGMRLVGIPFVNGKAHPQKLPPRDFYGSPVDGVTGTASAPFFAKPDQFGQSLPFAIVWAARGDVTGGILVRAAGLNSEHVKGTFDNTQIAPLIRKTLGITAP